MGFRQVMLSLYESEIQRQQRKAEEEKKRAEEETLKAFLGLCRELGIEPPEVKIDGYMVQVDHDLLLQYSPGHENGWRVHSSCPYCGRLASSPVCYGVVSLAFCVVDFSPDLLHLASCRDSMQSDRSDSEVYAVQLVKVLRRVLDLD